MDGWWVLGMVQNQGNSHIENNLLNITRDQRYDDPSEGDNPRHSGFVGSSRGNRRPCSVSVFRRTRDYVGE